jgi:hypothetical protein
VERYQQLAPQLGLVRLFQENCTSKKIADCMEWMETMDEAWTRMDESYGNPIQYTNELMLGIPVLPNIKYPEFRKLLTINTTVCLRTASERLSMRTNRTYSLSLQTVTK